MNHNLGRTVDLALRSSNHDTVISDLVRDRAKLGIFIDRNAAATNDIVQTQNGDGHLKLSLHSQVDTKLWTHKNPLDLPGVHSLWDINSTHNLFNDSFTRGNADAPIGRHR